MEIIVFIIIVALLLLPEFFHGWDDDSFGCTRKRIDGGDCFKHDHGRRF